MTRRIIGLFVFVVVAVGVAAAAYAGLNQAAGGGGPSEGEAPFPIPTDIPASAQLPVRAADIQVGADGKLFVPDRGDGCPLHETDRKTFGGREWVLLDNSSCGLAWEYAPDTGEVVPVAVITGDAPRTPIPSKFYAGPVPTTVPAAAQLPVEAGDFQAEPDGRLFVADRGDGCPLFEDGRGTFQGVEWVFVGNLWCEMGWRYAPSTGEVVSFVLIAPDTWGTPTPSDYAGPFARPVPTTLPPRKPRTSLAAPEAITLGDDGKYFRPDVGDGCVYWEVSRTVEEGQEWVLLQSPTCEPDISFAPATGECRGFFPTPAPVTLKPTPTPTPIIMGMPREDLPSPSEIQLGPDGKYFIPDRGDGCPWTEFVRNPSADGGVVVFFETECPNEDSWWGYNPNTG
ncbi:MAG: hypothetical protein MUP14_00750 [Dehalococcoidia bacterium]|nr:hypothetical protein [Dehalococcoidia bacterium]